MLINLGRGRGGMRLNEIDGRERLGELWGRGDGKLARDAAELDRVHKAIQILNVKGVLPKSRSGPKHSYLAFRQPSNHPRQESKCAITKMWRSVFS